MIVATFHDWAFKWLYQNDGVGNFTDDALLIIFIGYIGKRAWTTLKRKLDRNHHAVMALHAHHETGYVTPEEFQEPSAS